MEWKRGALAVLMLGYLPAVLAHELAHWAVGRWAASSADLHLLSTDPAFDVAEWDPDAAWLIVAAAYAPLALGVASGGVVLAWMLATGWWPAHGREFAVTLVGGAWWLVFMLPSGDDISVAQEGIDRARE